MPKLRQFVITCVAAGTALGIGALALVPVARLIGGATHNVAVAEPVKLRPLDLPSKVYDTNGKVIAVLQDRDYRAPVTLSQVPPTVVHAVLDAEDATFYQHGAIDFRSILRAFTSNVSSGGVVQGGSTITQQLVKNAVLNSQRSVDRKLHEAILAFRLEQQMSKDQILERYLNTVYLGNGAYGIQAAAQTYFARNVGDLDPAQAALLAGLIRNPVGYDPLHHSAAAVQRRGEVLDEMVVNGHLTSQQAQLYKATPVPSKINPPVSTQDSPFVEEVKASLEDVSDHRFDFMGTTVADRQNTLNTGGLSITTTFDPAMQKNAEDAVNAQLTSNVTAYPAGTDLNGSKYPAGNFTGAVVTMDPNTGDVRALVSGNPSAPHGYDVATGRGGSGRPPGSSFKPFTLMAALEAGDSMNDTIDGTDGCIISIPGYGTATLHNAEPGAGVMDLWSATAGSVNCAFLRLAADVGLPKITEVAHRMGIPPKVDLRQVLTLPIGTSEVTPLEMASAYSTLAADGVHHAPTFIQKVVDGSNNVQFQGASNGDRVVSAQNARVVTQALQGVVDHGTGTNARITDGRPVAGKTGTTDGETDAWFVGYTPQLVTAVWMGSPSGHVPMRNVPGAGQVFGGTYPAKIFSAFMSSTLSGKPVQNFNAPDPSAPGQYLTVPDSPNALAAPPPPPPPPAAPAPALPPDTPVPGEPPSTDQTIVVPPPPRQHGGATTTSTTSTTSGP